MIKVRERRGKWQCDIHLRLPDGTLFREQKNAPVTSKSAALRWAQDRERFLLSNGKPEAKPTEGLTLKDFWPRVVSDHYKALRRKASTIDSVTTVYNKHLLELHDLPLEGVTKAVVAKLKGSLKGSAKTVNNVLSVLSVVLDCAVDWEVLKALPCKVTLLPTKKQEMTFYEVQVYRRLVQVAQDIGPKHHALVLLAGSAGLRRGELRALRWKDVDLERGLVTVHSALWRKVEDTPKGGRSRKVDLTDELVAVLGKLKRRGDRVFYTVENKPLSNRSIRNLLGLVEKRAGMEEKGRAHVFRHTFCSHLALAGVPAKVIQELAGHADLSTTLKYMHLSPENKSDAIKTLGAFYTLPTAV